MDDDVTCVDDDVTYVDDDVTYDGLSPAGLSYGGLGERDCIRNEYP